MAQNKVSSMPLRQLPECSVQESIPPCNFCSNPNLKEKAVKCQQEVAMAQSKGSGLRIRGQLCLLDAMATIELWCNCRLWSTRGLLQEQRSLRLWRSLHCYFGKQPVRLKKQWITLTGHWRRIPIMCLPSRLKPSFCAM